MEFSLHSSGSGKSGCQQGEGCRPGFRLLTSCRVLIWQKGGRGQFCPHGLIASQKAPSPNTITWRIRISAYEFEDSEMFSPGFPGDSDGKESAYHAGDPGLIPGSERSPREGNDHAHQYSCLEKSMDRGVWWATVCGVADS